MHIKKIHLVSFRAHTDTTVEFAKGVNLIYGANGSGKTNILEAIHYIALTKSFLASNDTYALRKGCGFFEISGAFSSLRRASFSARIAFVPGEGKRIFINQSPLPQVV